MSIIITPRALGQNLKNLRQHGITPGIMYGQSLKTSLPIEMKTSDLQTILENRSNTTTFFVEYEGKRHECILRDYQTDRLHTEILHVDLQYVREGEMIKMNIPVAYDGMAFLSGKKLILEKAVSKIPVVGPIENLPEAFIYSIGTLDRGSKIFARQLVMPKDTELLMNPETIIATIQ